jgi:hypothetical protein
MGNGVKDGPGCAGKFLLVAVVISDPEEEASESEGADAGAGTREVICCPALRRKVRLRAA